MTAPDLSPAAVEKLAVELDGVQMELSDEAAATLRALVKANRERDLRLVMYMLSITGGYFGSSEDRLSDFEEKERS